MEQVDDVNDSVDEWVPERVGQSHLVLDLQVLTTENSHLGALLEQDLLLVWVGRVQGRVHSETGEAVEVVASNQEECRNKFASVSSWHGKLQGNLEAD